MKPNLPALFIIVGVTGDLAARKLLPALEALSQAGKLPEKWHVLGITRGTQKTAADVLASSKSESTEALKEHFSLFPMDMEAESEYKRLADKLSEIEETTFHAQAQRLFYLSVPPQASSTVIEMLGTSGLSQVEHTKLLLEKPFGFDEASAKEMIARIATHFTEDQVYRVDHYLGKEMVYSLPTFRAHNALFERTWNNHFLERIELRAHETIGIEGRVGFYEQTGALRDLVQSHLLQLAAIVLMEITPTVEPHTLRATQKARLVALKSLQITKTKPLLEAVSRGQYKGYREEVSNPESVVETCVSIELESTDERFAGIPILISTGKKLAEKNTEVRLFYTSPHAPTPQQLVIHIQPHEGMSIPIVVKRAGFTDDTHAGSFDFADASANERIPEAYERIFYEAVTSNHDFFVSSEEVLESWRILTPIQEAWKSSSGDLNFYDTSV